MPTIRVELYKGKKLTGMPGYFPVCITVTHKGIPRRKTVAAAKPEQWDPKEKRIKPRSRKDSEEVNSEIDDEYDKYKAIFKRLSKSYEDWNAEDVFKEPEKETHSMFKENAEIYISTLKNIFSRDAASRHRNKILRYTKDKDFNVSKVSERWISEFKHHCKTKEKNNKGGVGNDDNTIRQAIKFLKRVATFHGIESKILSKTKMKETESILEYPTVEDFKKLQEVSLTPGSMKWHALNIFSIQIYFRGMRIGDALRLEWSDFINGRLKYGSSKTNEDYNMEVLKVAQDILDQYKGIDRKYIFPFFNWEYNESLSEEVNAENENYDIKRATSKVNNNLKKLSKDIGIPRTITTHQARHMFAIWADELLKGDLGMIQKLLGHRNRAMTERYIKRLRHATDLDDAASTVLAGIG